MKTIWKYVLNDESQLLSIPRGGVVLTVANQNDQITMWVEVDPEAAPTSRAFRIVGTGYDLPDMPEGKDLVYQGSAVGIHGAFVFHVYEAY